MIILKAVIIQRWDYGFIHHTPDTQKYTWNAQEAYLRQISWTPTDCGLLVLQRVFLNFWLNWQCLKIPVWGFQWKTRTPWPCQSHVPTQQKGQKLRAAAFSGWDTHSQALNAYTRPRDWLTMLAPALSKENTTSTQVENVQLIIPPNGTSENINRFRVNPCSINPKSFVKEA